MNKTLRALSVRDCQQQYGFVPVAWATDERRQSSFQVPPSWLTHQDPRVVGWRAIAFAHLDHGFIEPRPVTTLAEDVADWLESRVEAAARHVNALPRRNCCSHDTYPGEVITAPWCTAPAHDGCDYCAARPPGDGWLRVQADCQRCTRDGFSYWESARCDRCEVGGVGLTTAKQYLMVGRDDVLLRFQFCGPCGQGRIG